MIDDKRLQRFRELKEKQIMRAREVIAEVGAEIGIDFEYTYVDNCIHRVVAVFDYPTCIVRVTHDIHYDASEEAIRFTLMDVKTKALELCELV